MADTGSPVPASTEPARVAGTEVAEPPSQATDAGSQQEPDLISFDDSDTGTIASQLVGNEADQARSADTERSFDLISLDDTETKDTSRNVRPRPNLSQEIR